MPDAMLLFQMEHWKNHCLIFAHKLEKEVGLKQKKIQKIQENNGFRIA